MPHTPQRRLVKGGRLFSECALVYQSFSRAIFTEQAASGLKMRTWETAIYPKRKNIKKLKKGTIVRKLIIYPQTSDRGLMVMFN